MNLSEYLLNGRQFTAFSPLKNELQFQDNKNYLFELSYLSSLQIEGERAAEFLQGQLSCDIRKVTTNTMQQGAMCNLKGRILALLDVLQWQNLQLILPGDLLVDTQNSLSKTAMLSRIQLKPSTDYQFCGFYLTNKNDLLPTLSLPEAAFAVTETRESCIYHLGNHFYLILIKKEFAEAFKQPFIDKEQMRGSLAWHLLQLHNKRVEIYPQTRGLFLPHRLDLHLSGYLNFNKGCYKGQEIVARTHYRAKLKHGLQVFTIETKETLSAGKRLFAAGTETEMGEIIDYCPLGDERYLIAASILLEHPDEVLIEEHKNSVLLKDYEGI